MELMVHKTEDDVATAAAELVSEAIAGTQGRFSLGLAGGTTPEKTYQRLREFHVGWSSVDAWLGDERWVPPDSERSNGHMAWSNLLRSTGAVLHRPEWGPGIEPDASAAGYGRLLRRVHADKAGPDVVLLGLGADGHTASLFPGSPALAESDHWYVANVIPESGEVRLTATYPLLATAALVVFLVMGKAKAPALRDSLKRATPAGKVQSERGRILWLVDEEAASLVI